MGLVRFDCSIASNLVCHGILSFWTSTRLGGWESDDESVHLARDVHLAHDDHLANVDHSPDDDRSR